MMVHAGSVHIHLRQPIQCAPESAMGCQSAQTGPGHARGRSLEENHKKNVTERFIFIGGTLQIVEPIIGQV